MTETPDAWRLTPDQATAALIEMQTAYKAAQPFDPQAELNKAYADPKFQEKLNAGSPDARAEFDRLVKAAADQNPVAAAMTGTLPDLPSSEQRLMASTASWMRELGLSEAVVEETLSGRSATPEEIALAKQWRADHEADPDWVKRLLAGGEKEKRELTLCSIIIANGAEKAA